MDFTVAFCNLRPLGIVFAFLPKEAALAIKFADLLVLWLELLQITKLLESYFNSKKANSSSQTLVSSSFYHSEQF